MLQRVDTELWENDPNFEKIVEIVEKAPAERASFK